MRTVMTLTVFLCLASPAVADVYMRSKAFMGGEIESWTSGKKQRTESQVPVIGKIVMVTRVDKGVEWTINESKKMYEEKPLALSYPPPADYSSEDETATGGYFGADMKDGDEYQDPVITKLPQQKKISGILADGFEIGEKGKAADMVVWIAPENRIPGQLNKEMMDYQKAFLNAQYANYPPAERSEMAKSLEAFGNMFMSMFSHASAGPANVIPRGVMMAMESKDGFQQGSGKPVAMFEILELKSVPSNAQMFELPGGFARVDDIGRAMTKDMIGGNIDFGAMMQQMGVTAGEGLGSAGGMNGMDDEDEDYGDDFDASQITDFLRNIGGQTGGGPQDDPGNYLQQLQKLQPSGR